MTTTPTSGAADLPEALRVPLDSLHADAAYLIGRLREGSMPYARVIEIIRERIDAAKAAIRASAAHGQAPAPEDSVQEDANCAWSNDELTAIYNEANGITVKNPPITTERIFAAMRRVAQIAARGQPAAQQGVAYAALPEKYYLAGGEVPTWDAKQMHAFADAAHTLRASHGQAPAGDWLWVKLMDFCKKRRFAPANFNDLFEIVDAARAARAQADSVQEDAARLDWLLLRISGAEFRRLGVHYSGNARRADVDAARKQGASHGR